MGDMGGATGASANGQSSGGDKSQLGRLMLQKVTENALVEIVFVVLFVAGLLLIGFGDKFPESWGRSYISDYSAVLQIISAFSLGLALLVPIALAVTDQANRYSLSQIQSSIEKIQAGLNSAATDVHKKLAPDSFVEKVGKFEKAVEEDDNNSTLIAQAILKSRAHRQLTTKVLKELERVLISATAVHGGGRVPMLTDTRYFVRIEPANQPDEYKGNAHKELCWYQVEYLSWNGFDFSYVGDGENSLRNYFQTAAGFADPETGFREMLRKLVRPLIVMPYATYDVLKTNSDSDLQDFINRVDPMYPFTKDGEIKDFGLEEKVSELRKVPWVSSLNQETGSDGSQPSVTKLGKTHLRDIHEVEQGARVNKTAVDRLQGLLCTLTDNPEQFGVLFSWELTGSNRAPCNIFIPFLSLYEKNGIISSDAKDRLKDLVCRGKDLSESLKSLIEDDSLGGIKSFLGGYVPNFDDLDKTLAKIDEDQIKAETIRMFQFWRYRLPILATKDGDYLRYEGEFNFPSVLFSKADFLEVELGDHFEFADRAPITLYGFETAPTLNKSDVARGQPFRLDIPKDPKLPQERMLLTPSDQFVIKWRANIPVEQTQTQQSSAQAAE